MVAERVLAGADAPALGGMLNAGQQVLAGGIGFSIAATFVLPLGVVQFELVPAHKMPAVAGAPDEQGLGRFLLHADLGGARGIARIIPAAEDGLGHVVLLATSLLGHAVEALGVLAGVVVHLEVVVDPQAKLVGHMARLDGVKGLRHAP